MVRPSPAVLAGRRPPPIPQEPLSIVGAPVLGRPDAAVAMVVFSDFECPFCAKFASVLMPLIKAKYVDTGRVQLAFRHLPLPIHERARQAAEIAVCAEEQQKFWRIHDLFFESGGLRSADLSDYAENAGLDRARLAACRDRADGIVARDLESAKRLGIYETPAFLIGSRRTDGRVQVRDLVLGLRIIEEFYEMFDRAEQASGQLNSRRQ